MDLITIAEKSAAYSINRMTITSLPYQHSTDRNDRGYTKRVLEAYEQMMSPSQCDLVPHTLLVRLTLYHVHILIQLFARVSLTWSIF